MPARRVVGAGQRRGRRSASMCRSGGRCAPPRYRGDVTIADQGFFGPDSVSWRVHREVTVLFGGARALLMQAAHPLVIAGARETGFYQRDPWKRLQRTLMLTYALTFGTREEAQRA